MGNGTPNITIILHCFIFLFSDREGNCNDLKTEVEGKVQGIVSTHKAKVCFNKIYKIACDRYGDVFQTKIICYG